MAHRKLSIFPRIGLFMLAATLLMSHWLRSNHADFAFGLLMGASIGMMIFGLMKHRRETDTTR